MRDLIGRLPRKSTIVDFEESMQLDSVRATTRLWYDGDVLVGFAFVDDWNNLRFEVDDRARSSWLEDEIIAWGICCMRKRYGQKGEANTLDASFRVADTWQIAMLLRAGFVQSDVRTLLFRLSLSGAVPIYPLPAGFSVRCVAGEPEVQDLVRLHRAAFGTQKMTSERRLAIMRAPGYERELDLVVRALDGTPAAFCICSIEEDMGSRLIGYTDPIGTHPLYRRLGLAKAIVSTGLYKLKSRGASSARLNTSSENEAMQQLALSLGFTCAAEKLWFSKAVA